MEETLRDISLPVSPATGVYPGDPVVRIRRFAVIGEDGFNACELSLSTHAGTHVDAPLHLFDGGSDAAGLDLRAMVGPVQVIHAEESPGVDRQTLEKACPSPPERLLIRTGAGAALRLGEPGWGYLLPEAAHWLVHHRVRLVGIESLSVDGPRAPTLPVHRVLLDAGVIIVEGLDLSAVPAGRYDLICLPLRLVGGDAAPARVLLRDL